MSYYMFYIRHSPRIHYGHCPSCNNGEGVRGNTGGKAGHWIGPFETFMEAENFARQNIPGHAHPCERCNPQ